MTKTLPEATEVPFTFRANADAMIFQILVDNTPEAASLSWFFDSDNPNNDVAIEVTVGFIGGQGVTLE